MEECDATNRYILLGGEDTMSEVRQRSGGHRLGNSRRPPETRAQNLTGRLYRTVIYDVVLLQPLAGAIGKHFMIRSGGEGNPKRDQVHVRIVTADLPNIFPEIYEATSMPVA